MKNSQDGVARATEGDVQRIQAFADVRVSRPRVRAGIRPALISEEKRRRRLIYEYFGTSARIRVLRSAPVFGAPVFVVDFDRGARRHRTFGSFGPVFAAAIRTEQPCAMQVTEQSSMDLLDTAQLIFPYERLMSLAFAQCERPSSALLLGVGGAAMWRFMRRYLPECTPTLVDNDEGVIANARRWFHLNQPVVLDSAERFLATTTARFDIILVDLYNSHGPAPFDREFWARCFDALSPGGCLATNWADFSTNARIRPMAESLAEIARARGHDCFYIHQRNCRDNLVQFVPTGAKYGPGTIVADFDRFVRQIRLTDLRQGTIENCAISARFPISPRLDRLWLAPRAPDLGIELTG